MSQKQKSKPVSQHAMANQKSKCKCGGAGGPRDAQPKREAKSK